MRRICVPTLAFLALPLLAQTSPPNPAPPPDSFPRTVRPFLEQNCQSCHNVKLRSGGINFELLKYSTSLGQQATVWETTAYVLKMGQMPPEQVTPRPAKDQVDAVIAVLERDLAKAKETATVKAPPPTREWLTWQGDQERTGWGRAETTLSKDNVSKLGLIWKSQLDAVVTKMNPYATLTDPLVVENVPTKQGPKKLVFVASAENNVYALEADTGATLWERKFPNTLKSPQATGGCANNLNANPVIDKQNGIIYILTNDGRLRGLGLADGDDRMPPSDFVSPYSRNWSLNLIDGLVYTSSSRGCGGAISRITAIDVTKPTHPVMNFYPSTGKASGPWGRGGIIRDPSRSRRANRRRRIRPSQRKIRQYLRQSHQGPAPHRLLHTGKLGLPEPKRFRPGIRQPNSIPVSKMDASSGRSQGRRRLSLGRLRPGRSESSNPALYITPIWQRRPDVRLQRSMGSAIHLGRRKRPAMGLGAHGRPTRQRNRGIVQNQQRQSSQRQHHGVSSESGKGQAGSSARMDVTRPRSTRNAGRRQRCRLRAGNRRQSKRCL